MCVALPSEKIETAIAAYCGGESALSIERRLGRSNTTLYRHLRARGVTLHRPRTGREARWCAWCGDDLPAGSEKGRKFCCRACFDAYVQDTKPQSPAKRCMGCGEEFVAGPKNRNYCCRACYENSRSRTSRADIEAVQPYADKGLTLEEISLRTGLSMSTARRILLSRRGSEASGGRAAMWRWSRKFSASAIMGSATARSHRPSIKAAALSLATSIVPGSGKHGRRHKTETETVVRLVR